MNWGKKNSRKGMGKERSISSFRKYYSQLFKINKCKRLVHFFKKRTQLLTQLLTIFDIFFGKLKNTAVDNLCR